MQYLIGQLRLLFIFTISGFLIGILFDIFRVLRKSFKTLDIITYLEDLLFWLITGAYLLFIIFEFCLGEIRLFMFISLIIGFITYMLTISKYFISLSFKLVIFVKNTIIRTFSILCSPFKLLFKILKKIFFKPITFITENLIKKIKKMLQFTVNKKE